MTMHCLLLLLVVSAFFHADGVGVNYGRIGNNLPSYNRVVNLIKSLPCANIKQVKIYDAATDVLNAFRGSGLQVVVQVENQDLNSFASSKDKASNWVNQKVAPFADFISTVAVGNEQNGNLNTVVGAMRNVRTALINRGLGSIKVTTPLAYSFLSNDFPPSSAVFTDLNSIRPLLDFLRNENSFFMVNIYPFFTWQGNKGQISLDYALFSDRVVVTDPQGNRGYKSLFDAQLDAVYAALDKAGYGGLKVVIGESGWPSAGDDGATKGNAQRFNSRLTQKVNSNTGTPRKPNEPVTAYIFALFNENQKGGPEIERHFGLLNADGSPAYNLAC